MALPPLPFRSEGHSHEPRRLENHVVVDLDLSMPELERIRTDDTLGSLIDVHQVPLTDELAEAPAVRYGRTRTRGYSAATQLSESVDGDASPPGTVNSLPRAIPQHPRTPIRATTSFHVGGGHAMYMLHFDPTSPQACSGDKDGMQSQRNRYIVNQFQQASTRRVEYTRLHHSNVKFRMGQFLEQMLLQTVLLWGVARVWYKAGVQGLRNVELMYNQIGAWIQVFTQLLLVLIVAARYLGLSTVSYSSVSITIATYITFRAVIAIKYAYMHPLVYDRWFADPNKPNPLAPISDDVRTSENLANWLEVHPAHVRRELSHTAHRLGVCLQQAVFCLASPLEVSSVGGEPASKSCEVQLETALTRILITADHFTHAGSAKVMSVVLGVFHSLGTGGVPSMLMGELPAPTTAIEWATVVALMLVSFYLGFVLFMFATSACVDYERRYHSLKLLEEAVSYKPPQSLDDDMFLEKAPPISLMVRENVHMFVLARRVLLNIGLRYHLRLQAYTSILLTAIGIAVAVLVVIAFEHGIAFSPLVLHISVDIIAVLAIIIISIMQGSKANALANAHQALLQARQVQIDDAVIACREDPEAGSLQIRRELTDTRQALVNALDSIKFDDTLHGVRIVGVRASPALFRSIIIAGSTILSLVFRLVVT